MNGRTTPRGRQHGISLLMVLLLLVVMSVLGVAVLRSSAMQERMSANLRDRNEAFQAAEAGLSAGRQHVHNTFNEMWDGTRTFSNIRDDLTLTCNENAVCDRSLLGDPEGDTVKTLAPTAWTRMEGRVRYGFIIEYLGTGKGSHVPDLCDTPEAREGYQCQRPIFRVTSVGRGGGDAEVRLQAIVINRGDLSS